MIECENLPLRSGRTLSFTLRPGEFLWVTGRPGSGKTSLLARLAARRPIDGGRARVLGTALESATRAGLAALRRQIGVLGEEPRLLPELTVAENIALPLRIRGVRAGRAAADAAELADWLGLGAILDRDGASLSRGERQLCALARAVIGRPKLLLADEPGAGLDDGGAARAVLLLAELAGLGTAVLAATSGGAGPRTHGAPMIRLDTAATAPARADEPVPALPSPTRRPSGGRVDAPPAVAW